MAWKKREKPLTGEEAIAFAKKELAPFWFGSQPMMAAIRGPDGQVRAHPLDAEFLKKPRLIFLFDPTLFSGEEAMQFVREWHRRYHLHELEFLLVFQPSYSYQRTRAEMERLAQKKKLPLPLVMDADGMLSAAFGASELPKMLLLHQSKFLWQSQGKDWLKGAELHLQQFLRSTDPGLPLLPVYEPMGQGERILQDRGRVELGSAGAATLAPAQVVIQGKWQQDGEKIFTSDPDSSIQFVSAGSHVALIAEAHAEIGEETKIEILVDDAPAWDEIKGENLSLRDEGTSILIPEKADIYQILRDLPAGHRRVTLRFSNADRGAAAIYGIRFGA